MYGTRVHRAKAVTKQPGDRTFHFCSHHCRHAFEASPKSYLDENGHLSRQATADTGSHPRRPRVLPFERELDDRPRDETACAMTTASAARYEAPSGRAADPYRPADGDTPAR